MSSFFTLETPLPGARFGGIARTSGDAQAVVKAAEAQPAALPKALAASGGVLLLKGLHDIAQDAALLVRLSRLFGPEVEDYRRTLTPRHQVHDTVPEIFIVSNVPPVSRMPPPRPEPPLTADGKFPVQYPQRKGWHTDQSYRRPPPDISLFFAVAPVTRDQGQTLFASGTLAYEALSSELKRKVGQLEGLHAQPGSGRSRDKALAGIQPRAFAAHERSQRQPVVRIHPVTGKPALYLCESGQMDWFEGPFVGMQPGPHGDGAALVDELMAHYTRPEFIYVHEWDQGDLIVWDNRCLVHAATWFDASVQNRVMWRTTVHGNPGGLYAGEKKSWIPELADASTE
ncbi:MAG: TauD/TfdA family dioxygenase [Alphaproteobacteria bacterium]|nr:TauD/TfdA family dioxygenase [Alphaproteobacteria bacterium]